MCSGISSDRYSHSNLMGGSFPSGGIACPSSLEVFLSSSIGSWHSGCSHCRVFLIMSQVTVTTTAITPYGTVVCSGAMLITMIAMLASISGPEIIRSAWCVSATTFDSKGYNEGSVGLIAMSQYLQTQCQMPCQAYASYAMGPPQAHYSFRFEHPIGSLCHVLVSVLVFAFYFQVPMWLSCSPMGDQLWGLRHHNPSEYTFGRHIYQNCSGWYILASLQGSYGGVIAVSKVHELCTKIHDIQDSAVSKWVGIMACILAYLYNSASRQCHEVWDFTFPFLYNMKDSVPTCHWHWLTNNPHLGCHSLQPLWGLPEPSQRLGSS